MYVHNYICIFVYGYTVYNCCTIPAFSPRLCSYWRPCSVPVPLNQLDRASFPASFSESARRENIPVSSNTLLNAWPGFSATTSIVQHPVTMEHYVRQWIGTLTLIYGQQNRRRLWWTTAHELVTSKEARSLAAQRADLVWLVQFWSSG